MAPQRLVSLVLAAGAAIRFGSPKQLAPLRGRPLLEHALAAAEASPSEATVVVLGARAKEVMRGVALGGATVVRCGDWERGQGASLRAGIAALDADVAAVLVTLGDEPFVSPEAARRLIAARRPGLAALRATYGGRPGHPVLIERELFAPLADARLEVQPAELLRAGGIEAVDFSDLEDPADVDTPDQLAALEGQD